MFKKIFLVLILICSSCQKQKPKAVLTNKEYINFENYTFNTKDGSKEKIVLDKGRKYILDFWYLECAPCVQQHKEIHRFQKELLKNNVEVIGFSIDRNQENWKSYLDKHQFNWKNYNQFYAENDLKYDLGIKLFPTYFIVDDKGNIEKKFNSFKKVIAYLKL